MSLTLASVAAATLAAAAAALAVSGGRTTPVRSRSPASAHPRWSGRVPPADDFLGRHQLFVSVLAGAAALLLLGGVVGLVAGVLGSLVVRRTLRRRESAGDRRRREAITRSLPQVVDLLAVALSAGAAPATALGTVAAAVDGPVAAELEAARHGLSLGRDPVRLWRELGQRPGMSALGRTMARATESGASVSGALHRLAEDLQASARSEAESRARTVGVRAAAPLGLCLLPAFVLVGVVPLVASTVVSLLAP